MQTNYSLSDLTEQHARQGRARAFVEGAMCKMLSGASHTSVSMLLEERLGAHHPYVHAFQKAATLPISTTGVPADLSPFGRAFIERVNQRSAFGSLGFPLAPFNTRVGVEVAGTATAGWVGELQPIPVIDFASDLATLVPGKLAAIALLTRELVRSADPLAPETVERLLVRVVSVATDAAAFDPADAQSLVYGGTELPAADTLSGTVRGLLAAISDGAPSRPALVLGQAAARALFFSGEDAFRHVALIGQGSMGGVVTFTSPAAVLREVVIAIDAEGVLVGDGGIDTDQATAATVRMTNAPAEDTEVQQASLFQLNLTGLRVTRYLAWIRRADAIAYTTLGGSPA